MATITLEADGTLIIPGGFTVDEDPPFSLRSPDGEGFVMPELVELKAEIFSLKDENVELRRKIANAQKALA